MKVPNAEQAIVDMRKLLDYALDLEHPYGRHKAIVFQSALGIGAKHADLVRYALLDAVKTNDVTIGQNNEYGQRYTVDFEMVGPNGKRAIVRSGWIIRFDEDFPRLATAFVV